MLTSFSEIGDRAEGAPPVDHIFLVGSWAKKKFLNQLVRVGSRNPGKKDEKRGGHPF